MQDHYALVFKSHLIFIFYRVCGGIRFFLCVVAPLLHAVTHGEHLALEPGAGCAGEQVQAQRNTVACAQRAVFPGDEQGGRFSAGPSEWHHG
jgi:hypothetical protein